MSNTSSRIIDALFLLSLITIIGSAGFVHYGWVGAIIVPIIVFGVTIIVWEILRKLLVG